MPTETRYSVRFCSEAQDQQVTVSPCILLLHSVGCLHSNVSLDLSYWRALCQDLAQAANQISTQGYHCLSFQQFQIMRSCDTLIHSPCQGLNTFSSCLHSPVSYYSLHSTVDQSIVMLAFTKLAPFSPWSSLWQSLLLMEESFIEANQKIWTKTFLQHALERAQFLFSRYTLNIQTLLRVPVQTTE